MKKLRYICVLFGIVVIFGACGRKWKKTTETNFNIQVNLIDNGFLTLNQGEISIGEFDFAGSRKQGDDVSFENIFFNAALVNVATSDVNPPLNYDIPQGTYTDLHILLHLSNSNGNVISLTGWIQDDSISKPVVFEFDENLNIDLKGKSSSGGQYVILVTGTPATATITLNISDWFATISNNMLDDAETTDVGGIQTIVINSSNNQTLYNTVISRINQFNNLVF